MSRPSHWLSLWFLALGLGMWTLGAFDRAPLYAGFVETAVLQHSGRQALAPVSVTLNGRVVDRLGWPVKGAEIEGPSGERAMSDAEGRFALEVKGTGQQQLIARADGHGAASARGLGADPMLLVLGPAVPWQAGPRPRPASEILLAGEGELVDSEGSEIAGGRVLVLETGDTVQADEYGRFRLPLPPGSSHLIAYDAMGRVGEMVFQPSRTQGVLPVGEIELRDGLDLVGVLRSSENHPCAEAMVQLVQGGMIRQEFTDAAGQFAFRGLIAGEYVLTAMPHRGDLGFAERIALNSDYDADWSLKPARELRIQVLSDQQAPKSGAHVFAEEPGRRSAYAQADEEGRVFLDGLGEGPYDFEVRDLDLSRLPVLGFDEEFGHLIVGDVIVSTKER